MAESPNEARWWLSDDMTKALVELPGEPGAERQLQYSADQLNRLIERLAELRSAMQPALPMADPQKGTKLKVARVGRWWVQPQIEPAGITLAILHPGLGWVGIGLPQHEISNLVQLLLKFRPAEAETQSGEVN